MPQATSVFQPPSEAMIESLPIVAEVVMGVMGCILNSECEICYSQNARRGSGGFSPVFIFNLYVRLRTAESCLELEKPNSMKGHLNRARLATPVFLGAITLAAIVVLFVWDALPGLFPSRAHDYLGALPLALIAIAYLIYEAIRRPGPAEVFKAILLVLAFLFWAANQFWPDSARATLFNDIAIALFVFDVFLVIVGWPVSSPDESFADSYKELKTGGFNNEGGSQREL
jgi:hypothetical protein